MELPADFLSLGRGSVIDSREGTERAENGLQRDEATSGTAEPTSTRATTSISTSAIHPLDSLGVTGPTIDNMKIFYGGHLK